MSQAWQDACCAVFDDWDKRCIVASPDLDGLLTAAILRKRFGADVIAFYTTRHIVLLEDADSTKLVNALWVDHDISYPGVRCIGQHLILHDRDDQLPLRHNPSFNPNHFFGQDFRRSFGGYGAKRRDKYPYATIHFVMNALREHYPKRGTVAYAMFAHADSSWKNVLLYEYNCTIWADLMFRQDLFIQDLLQCEVTPRFLDRLGA